MSNSLSDIIKTLESRVRKEAKPLYKWNHLERIWDLSKVLGKAYSDLNYDYLYIAILLHDIGTYFNHRPEKYAHLEKWDHLKYAIDFTNTTLKSFKVPEPTINYINDIIRGHLPKNKPASNEAIVLHDADLLDSIGILGISRALYKIGDTVDQRFHCLDDAIEWLNKQHDIAKKYLITKKAREILAIKEHHFTLYKEHILAETIQITKSTK